MTARIENTRLSSYSTAAGGIASYVRYSSPLFGVGWLCTDGTIASVADAAESSVRIVCHDTRHCGPRCYEPQAL